MQSRPKFPGERAPQGRLGPPQRSGVFRARAASHGAERGRHFRVADDLYGLPLLLSSRTAVVGVVGANRAAPYAGEGDRDSREPSVVAVGNGYIHARALGRSCYQGDGCRYQKALAAQSPVVRHHLPPDHEGCQTGKYDHDATRQCLLPVAVPRPERRHRTAGQPPHESHMICIWPPRRLSELGLIRREGTPVIRSGDSRERHRDGSGVQV